VPVAVSGEVEMGEKEFAGFSGTVQVTVTGKRSEI